MDKLMQRIASDNEKNHYWLPSDVVLVAVSAGVDSMALLDVIRRLAEEGGPQVEVVHVHHHLRESADGDLKLLETYCQLHQLPCHVRHWHQSEHPNSNWEEAARHVRYQFFEEQMEERQASCLLTAHHADDQMETILMKLTRGSTLSGYSGMKAVRPFGNGRLIRPLLSYEKNELYRYCHDNGVPYQEDETNQSMAYTRNRYRHQLLPLIKQENQQASQHFQAFSQQLQDIEELLSPLLTTHFARLFQTNEDGWQLDRLLFIEETPALQRLVLTYFFETIGPKESIFISKKHLPTVLAFIQSDLAQGELNLVGLQLKKRYNVIYFHRGSAENEKEHKKMPIYKELKLNQWLELEINGKIGLFLFSNDDLERAELNQVSFVFRQADVQLPLMVRPWQPGDKIQLNPKHPFTKKIARLFVDRKVPKEERQRAQVVCDANGTVLWLMGYATSVLLTEASQQQMNQENNEYLILVFENNDEVKM